MERGRGVADSALDEVEEQQCVNEACMLIFTSGTTGLPKGMKKVPHALKIDTQDLYLSQKKIAFYQKLLRC